MDQPYAVVADRERRLIAVRFMGTFWTPQIKRRFLEDGFAAFHSLGCQVGQQVILIDLRLAILQSQKVIASMQKLLADPLCGRVAMVAATPLARMQTKRLQVRDEVRMFPDMASAEAWLFDRRAVAA